MKLGAIVLDSNDAEALACGAALAQTQLEKDWRVLLDVAGHPFCILPSTPPAS